MATRAMPKGLKPAGQRLWKQLTTTYCWDDVEERLHTAEMLCRTLDLVNRIQADLDALESLRTQGSRPGHMIAAPEVAMLISARAQYTALQKALMLSEADVPEQGADRSGPMSRSESARIAAAARWRKHVS